MKICWNLEKLFRFLCQGAGWDYSFNVFCDSSDLLAQASEKGEHLLVYCVNRGENFANLIRRPYFIAAIVTT